MQKKNNLFDERIHDMLEQQTDSEPEAAPKQLSVIKIIAIVFVILFALSIILRVFVR